MWPPSSNRAVRCFDHHGYRRRQCDGDHSCRRGGVGTPGRSGDISTRGVGYAQAGAVAEAHVESRAAHTWSVRSRAALRSPTWRRHPRRGHRQSACPPSGPRVPAPVGRIASTPSPSSWPRSSRRPPAELPCSPWSGATRDPPDRLLEPPPPAAGAPTASWRPATSPRRRAPTRSRVEARCGDDRLGSAPSGAAGPR